MNCDNCDKELSKDEIAMMKKMVSRKTKQFLCLDCLAVFLNTSKEALLEKMDQFKEEGCDLFV